MLLFFIANKVSDVSRLPGYTFMSQNKQSRKYFIGLSYKNEEFDWPFDLVIVTWKNNRLP